MAGGPTQRRAAILAATATLATLTAVAAASPTQAAEPPLCVKIAVIDTHRPAKTTAPRVRRCEAVIRALRPKCREAPIRLADMAVTSQRLLRRAGITESVLSILTHVNTSIPAALGRMRCADIFAVYVTLRGG